MDGSLALHDVLDGPWCAARVVMADLDGCLVAGDTLLPGAADLAAAVGPRLWIVSNNSTDTAASLAARLAAHGLSVPAGRILLAGEQTLIGLAARHPGARLALFAAPVLAARAQSLGFRLDRANPALAVLARDPGFAFADLARLIALAHRGVPVWLTNPDPFHPGPDGTPVPETGVLWAALTAAVPVAAAGCIGKPAPDLLQAVLAAAGAAADQAVFLGDTPATDGAAARAAGVTFLRIRPPGAAQGLRGAAPC